MCLMVKKISSNLEEDQVSAPTYDELLHIYEKVYIAYEYVKKEKKSSFKEKISSLEKIHNSSLVKLEDLEKALDELKSDEIRMEIEFFEKLNSLTLENENLKSELIECRKSASTPRRKSIRYMHSFPKVRCYFCGLFQYFARLCALCSHSSSSFMPNFLLKDKGPKQIQVTKNLT